MLTIFLNFRFIFPMKVFIYTVKNLKSVCIIKLSNLCVKKFQIIKLFSTHKINIQLYQKYKNNMHLQKTN